MDANDYETGHSIAFFISAAGDTGNTYLLNTLIDDVRSKWGNEGESDYDEPPIGPKTTFVGIAATLSNIGNTFHSKVKAPCTNLNTDICCPISAVIARYVC
jgi:hypothetical protein